VVRPPAGVIENEPALFPPTSLPNTGSESNRGRHNQSMEPDDEQSAAVLPSPMRP
jgi:hypothetical protein